MSEFVGVKCATCGEFIKVGQQVHGAAVGYTVGLDSYHCDQCGSQHLYRTADLVDEFGDPLPYRPV